MKRLLLIVYIFCTFQCFSQTIQGRIVDIDTKKPVAGVIVYIAGTAIGQQTDSLGNFYIGIKSDETVVLKSNYLGYSDLIINNIKIRPDSVYKLGNLYLAKGYFKGAFVTGRKCIYKKASKSQMKRFTKKINEQYNKERQAEYIVAFVNEELVLNLEK